MPKNRIFRIIIGMRAKKIFVYTFALGMLALLLLKPEVYARSVKSGLVLFAVSVLPGTFPFFFYGKLLTLSGFGNDFSKALGKPFSKVYHTPPVSAYVFVMSMLSGYPAGAKMLADFYSEGVLCTAECKKISTFTSVAGPIFIVGTVGTGMLQNKAAGYAVLACCGLAALLNGLVFKTKSASSEAAQNFSFRSADNLLSESIDSAVLSVLTVGGYVALFGMISDAAINLKIIRLLTLPFEKFGTSAVQAISCLGISLLEVTRGMLALSETSLSMPIKIALASGAISFGGLSVTLQSVTFLSKCKIKAGFYLLSKTTQGVIGFALGLVAGKLFF